MDNKNPQIEAVVFDWAGTTVDYGCFAPLDVFIEIFKEKEIDVTEEEAREPMGTLKWDHIHAMLQMDRIKGLWKDKFGQEPTTKDVDDLYARFEPLLFEILPNYCTPIPGVLDLIKRLRSQGLKIGSTTGYTQEMMDVVAPGAKKLGYEPDNLVTPDDLPQGRPAPWMVFMNAMALGVYPMKHIIKVGDTISDVREGVNSGAWSVGVVLGGSEMGLTEEEANNMDPDELFERMEDVKERFKAAGANYVIDHIGQLDQLIPKINLRLQNGD